MSYTTYDAVMASKFGQAVRAFQAVQEEYSEFGASDTEPRAEFSIYIESIVRAAVYGGDEQPLPRTIRDWQIFDAEILGKTGAGKAARELTKAANLAGKEARKDIAAAAAWDRMH